MLIVRQFPFRVNPPCLKTKELKQSYLLNLGGRLDNFLKKRLYMDKRWKTNKSSVYDIGYHIIWCPKYRRKILTGEIESRLRELLLFKSTENGWVIENMEIMPDHIHIFIKATPSDSKDILERFP